MAYPIFIFMHSALRWLVLLFGLAAIGLALAGWFGRKPWTGLDNRLGMLYTMSLDLQFLVGLILYFVVSPITTTAFSNFGGAMSTSGTRFFLVEHLALMLIAIIVAHIGRSRSRKAGTDLAKHRNAAIFFIISLVLIFLAIPWPFMAVGRPLLRGL